MERHLLKQVKIKSKSQEIPSILTKYVVIEIYQGKEHDDVAWLGKQWNAYPFLLVVMKNW